MFNSQTLVTRTEQWGLAAAPKTPNPPWWFRVTAQDPTVKRDLYMCSVWGANEKTVHPLLIMPGVSVRTWTYIKHYLKGEKVEILHLEGSWIFCLAYP